MATFGRIRAVCILSVIAVFIRQASTNELDKFHFIRIPCETKCECYSWIAMNANASQTYDRFTVNCIGWKFGFLQGLTLPPIKNDSLYKELNYELNARSFKMNTTEQEHENLVLRGRNITYVSYKTFNLYSIRLLHHIDLNFNMIEELHANTFTFQSNLKAISIANNKIDRIARYAFRNLDKLEWLNLSHNSLKTLNFDMLHNVPSLRILDFSYNRLKTLPQTWTNVHTLEVLDLSYNKLCNLPWKNLSQLSFLKELGLRGNPWKCTCQMKDILSINRSLLVGSQAACQLPHRLRGVLLEDLNWDTFSYCSIDTESEEDIELVELWLPVVFYVVITNPYVIMWVCNTRMTLMTVCYFTSMKLVEYNPRKPRKLRKVGQIIYNVKNINWHGNTFEGMLRDGRKALIKIYPVNIPISAIEELNMHFYLSDLDRPHRNIIQYICFEQDTRFTYVAFEHCVGDLVTAVMKGELGFGVDQRKYFVQLASAISFLHENGIQHCNISPQNILCKKTLNGLSLVISDFKRHRRDTNCGDDRIGRRSRSEDMFRLGYVFYFMLTREKLLGKKRSILDPEYFQSALHRHFCEEQHIASMATNLVFKMICPNPLNRIKAHELKEQPFLWSNKKRMRFFRRIGNLMQDKDDPNVIRFKKELEKGASKIFVGNWMNKLDRVVQSDLKGFKSAKKEVCGLLRVIRNKIEHFEDIRSLELREIYSDSPDGVVEYYMKCFPDLVPYAHSILEESRLLTIQKN